MNTTICALATGLINCAIHIIRVSGEDAFNILQKITKLPVKKEGFIIQRNYIVDDCKMIDDVLLNTYVAPKSYTGEDTIEINCHGGIIVAKQIMNLLIKNGCVMAKNGEFSQRALLNKKMNYQQIEAINNLIFADNEITTELAINAVVGNDSIHIETLRERIFNIIGTIEINIDYPEYDDVKQLENNDILKEVVNIKNELDTILKNSFKVQPIIKGIKIAIIGSPNVGKSSLLNLLSNQEKAIVSDEKGTTRDIIESDILINGIKVTLIDTAGIRDTDNKIEQIGIQKAMNMLNEANIVIHLKEEVTDGFVLPKNIDMNKVIEVYNKSDINCNQGKINISVKNKDIKELIKTLEQKIEQIDFSQINTLILQSDRQIKIIEKIIYVIDDLIIDLKNNVPLDLIIQKLEIILNEFDAFLGKKLQYDKLDEMFRKFCLGK